MSHLDKRTLNKGDTVAEIPLDYFERWDATTSTGMTFATDEATGDVQYWDGQRGNVILSNHGTGTRGVWTPGQVLFAGTGNRGLGQATLISECQDASHAVFVCGKMNTGGGNIAACSLFAGPEYYYRAEYDTGAGGQINFFYNDGVATDNFPTNDLLDTPLVVGANLKHTGTANTYDIDQYWGADTLNAYTSLGTLNTGLTGFFLGMANTAGTTTVDGEVYECIIYDRELTAAECGAVCDYLSAKWQAQNQDSASSVIHASTERTWISESPDPDGKALTSYTPVNHKVEAWLQNPQGPVRFNGERDKLDNYPIYIPNLRAWFRSDQTTGMTFATGDAVSGGTVSSWLDITGAVTLDTTTSGDSAVDYRAGGSVRGSFPSVEGGVSAAGKSLEGPTIGLDNTTGQQRLYWSVGTFGDATKISSWGSPHSDTIFGCTLAVFSADMVGKPAVSYCSGTTSPVKELIADAGTPADDGKIHIFVWRVTDTGTDALVESWYSGLKLPDRTSTTADGDPIMSVGATSASNYDAEGAQMLELGMAASTTATIQEYSDAQVQSVIRYLCDRYDVDYMPEHAPLTIGAWSRQTTTLSQTDCCLWYDPSTIGAKNWALHPECAQYHTTPTNFTLQTGAISTAVPLTLESGVNGHECVAFDENTTVDQHMESANTYSSTETTDFPADTDGMSTFLVMYIDSGTITANGARCGNAIADVRNPSTTNVEVYGGSTSTTHATSTDKWILVGTSYAYDDDGTGTGGFYPGASDLDPACYHYLNNLTPVALDTPTNTSFTVENWVNYDAADGEGKVAEIIVFKHPLDEHEVHQLQRYAQAKYQHDFEFVSVQPHRTDANTIAHWSWMDSEYDEMGNKAAFDSGTYAQATITGGTEHYTCLDHNGKTAGYRYNAIDSDLDTHGAFTWAACIYLDSGAAGTNWRPLVRSMPPAGGSGSANNTRYSFRIEYDETLKYHHQYDNKVTQFAYHTATTVPIGSWSYVAVTRSADGSTVRVMQDGNITETTGLTAPNNGANSRFEMFEEWDGDDFDGYVLSSIFKNKESSIGELLAMYKQCFPNA
jgi:hypothetical protein